MAQARDPVARAKQSKLTRSKPIARDRLQVDAELAEFDDRRPAPAGRVGREGLREQHPVLLPERLPVAQDVVLAGRRLDGRGSFVSTPLPGAAQGAERRYVKARE
jgi:hypothetical protein